MDTLKLLFQAARPQKLIPRLKLYSGLGLAGLAILYIPYNFYQKHYVEKYQLTVCWPHYRIYKKAFAYGDVYESEDIINKYQDYTSCLDKARKGAAIHPPLPE